MAERENSTQKEFNDETWYGDHLPNLARIREIEYILSKAFPDHEQNALLGNLESGPRHLRLVKIASKSSTIVGSGMPIEAFMKYLPIDTDPNADILRQEWYSRRNYLIGEYEAFVMSIVNRYKAIDGLPLWVTEDDLEAIGRLGLLRGILKYDLARKTRLTTVAHYWIRSEMSKFIRRQIDQKYPSLDQELGESGENFTRYDTIASTASVVKEAEQSMVAELVQRAFADLEINQRDRDVAYMRLIEEKTLEEVGAEFGLTRERVRQIEAKIVRRLRNNPHFKKAAVVSSVVHSERDLDKRAYTISPGLRQTRDKTKPR